MSSQSERSIVMQMIKSGANGYLLKSASFEEYRAALKLAINGKLAFCNEVKELINKTNVNDLKTIPRLTQREKEIKKWLYNLAIPFDKVILKADVGSHLSIPNRGAP